MNNLKKKIYLLYRLTAKLNLYAARGNVKKDRVINEAEEIKELAEEIINFVNNIEI